MSTSCPLFDLWNANCHPLPKAMASTDKRNKAAKSRFADQPDPVYWEGVIKKMASSPFCRGENNTGWKANFDFLLKPDTPVKVLEGKYDAKVGGESNIDWDEVFRDK